LNSRPKFGSTLRGRDPVITLLTWRFIICTSASDALEIKLYQMSPLKGKRGKSFKESRKNSKQKSLIRKRQFNLATSLLGVGGIVALILTGGFSELGSNLFSISKAQAANIPVVTQLDLAKQAISNAAPIIQDNLPVIGVPVADSQNVTVTPPDGFLAKPLVAETTITQDPKPVVKKTMAVKTVTRTVSLYQAGDSVSNHFPYGYCTYYVASKRPIPWFGNAGTWLTGARAYGFATGSVPQVGAIMVTYEGGAAGHVAYVEAVNGDQVTVSEMNYLGFGIISSRVISANSPVIKGFIY